MDIMLKRIKQILKRPIKLLNVMHWSIKNLCKFVKYNFFSKQILKSHRFAFIPESDTILQLDKNAKIIIEGTLKTGHQQVIGAKQQTRIWLEEGAELHIKGDFTIGAGSYIRVWKNSKLILHSGFFNENVQVTAGDVVEIGEGATIGRDVVIRSYDGHTVLAENYQIAKSISIGNYVWIGQGASILKGVNIDDGSIVAADAVVTKDVSAHCAVAGNPARVIKENVYWK